MSTNLLMIDNSNVLELLGLRNALSGDYVNTAVVAATLQDVKGADVVGQVWPVVLNYQVDSKGCYRALLDSGLVLIKNKQYKLTLVAQGEGLDARWETFIKAQVRR